MKLPFKPTRDRLPNHLKAWRKFRKLSQEKAAARVDVGRTTLGRIEKGELPYNQDFMEKLALAYGCEVVELLSIDPTKPDPPRLVYEKLRRASPEAQKQALDILDALLKNVA